MKILKAESSKIMIEHCGKIYDCLDFTSGGIFCAIMGNNNPVVREAIKSQADQFISAYNHETDIRTGYINELKEFTGFPHVALFSDGTTAVEAALKIMRANGISGISEGVLSIEGNFHGKSLGASMIQSHKLAWPDKNPYTQPYKWDSSWFDCAGIILEGYRGYDAAFYPDAWIDALKEYIEKHDKFLCIDEVQSGFFRTGKMFAFDHYGLDPDLVVIGKAMGNGFPISGILSKEPLDDYGLSCTHGGNPLACAAGWATLEELMDYNFNYAIEKFEKELSYLKIKHTGRGMVAALHFENDGEAVNVWGKLLESGLFTVKTGRHTIKLAPPLTTKVEEIDTGFEIIKEVLAYEDIKT